MKIVRRITPFVFGVLLLIGSHTQATGDILKPGDIIYADSGNAIDGGMIIKVDPATLAQTVIAVGGHLTQPFAPAIAADGTIIVSDTSGTIVRVDPVTGEQMLLADNSNGRLGMPLGITLDSLGAVVVANAQAVVRVQPVTGETGIVSSGGTFLYPIGVTASDRGDLLVLNRAFPNEVIRVNPRNGTQIVVSVGGLLNQPQAIAAAGDDIYISDVAPGASRVASLGRIIHIDRRTGRQTVVAEGGFLVVPVGLAIDESGHLLVGDPYTADPETGEPYAGGIVRVNPLSGEQVLIASGHDGFVNPRGVAVVPTPSVDRGMAQGKSAGRGR